MAADGQVTLGDHVLKHSAKKIRRLYQDKILAGFAGSTADAFNLFQRFETKLEQYAGNLNRAAVELAKDWRTDKMLRNLEALLVVADKGQTFLISGSGDVIDPDEPIAAIGSGGSYAVAAARALQGAGGGGGITAARADGGDRARRDQSHRRSRRSMKVCPLSATSRRASRLRSILSVRQSLASSTAARWMLPAYCSSLDSKRVKRLKASAVEPANPARILSW